jgi:HKD family nuclease
LPNTNIGNFSINTTNVQILHQPITNTANRIIYEVENAEPAFTKIKFLSAYTSVAGVEIFAAILRKLYSKNKSTESRISVGIDQKRTPFDALNKLLQLKGMFPNLQIYIVNDKRVNYTFHPKVYLFESSSYALLFIGSNNLTKTGLSSNYEISATFRVELQNGVSASYTNFIHSIDPYFNSTPKGYVKELNYDLLMDLDKNGFLQHSINKRNVSKSSSKLFGKGQTTAIKTQIRFSKHVSKISVKKPQVGLQLTKWDTDRRHSETQIPKDVLNNGFFPKDQLTLVFPNKKKKQAKLSHYTYHSRIYNKEILDYFRPKEGDVLEITRISKSKFGVKLVRKNKIGTGLLSKLNIKKGKGKKWGWL